MPFECLKRGGMEGTKIEGPEKGLDNKVPVWISGMT